MTKLTEDRAFAENYFNFISSRRFFPIQIQMQQRLPINSVKGNSWTSWTEELLKSFDQLKGHHRQVEALSAICKSSLKACAPHLRSGFNFLCYGYGRKQDLLDQVIRKYFQITMFHFNWGSEGCPQFGPVAFSLVLNTPILPLSCLSGFNSDSSATKSSILSKTDLICSQKSLRKVDNNPLLHQLDSLAFDLQSFRLSSQTENAKYSIVASLDNPALINLFGKERFEEFNWLDGFTTMQPYRKELNRFALDACTNSASRQTPRCCHSVLQSLTTNSRSNF